MIVNNFNTNNNFWDSNPQLKIAEDFAVLYKSDKSKGKEDSSKIMWAIALVYDPKSKYYNLPIKSRKQIIARDYLGDESFNFDEYQQQVSFYTSLTISPARRHLVEWNNKLDEKTEFLVKTRYTGDTWKMIEEMLINNTKLYSELARISESLEKEGEEGVTRGGSSESASETGVL